ncbi:MAG: FadR family transcriptional regulator [Treponema sp.]|jgi:DNA-binding FadR family transcriptional regulator|nr:FadR family transcriptional regulator [Treponema sp.]
MDRIDYAVNKTNLYEQIADTLEQAIIRSNSPLGKLPSEQELAKRFQVSRTVIREALKVLKERGLIQSRNGEGSYISKPNTDTISSAVNRLVRMDNISNDELHSIRMILETQGVRLAAVRIQNDEIDHLGSVLSKMADIELPLRERIRLEMDFHVTIARSSGNSLLGMFVEVMTILLHEYMIKGISGSQGIKKTLAQHRKILEAVKKRDADGAEAALRAHLIASRKGVDQYEERKNLKSHKASTADKRR